MSAIEMLAARARVVCDAADLSAPPPSPCVSVCHIDPAHGLCQGCLRSLDEIAAWGQASPTWQRAVWAKIGVRSQLLADQR